MVFLNLLAGIKRDPFSFPGWNAKPVTPGMDYSNIDVRNINLLVTDFFPVGDTPPGQDQAAFRSWKIRVQRAFTGWRFQCKPEFSQSKEPENSDGSLSSWPRFWIQLNGWTAYNDFLNKVHIMGIYVLHLWPWRGGNICPDTLCNEKPL